MKKIFIFLILLLMIQGISSTNFQIEKKSSNEIMIVGLDKQTVFDLEIKNLEKSDNFEFYNLIGFNMFPKGTVYFNRGETKNIELKISPIGELKNRGNYNFNYYIKGENSSEITKELTFKIIELKDVFKIGSEKINQDLNTIDIYIENKENVDFKEIDSKFSSVFFEFEETFSLEPYERKNFTIQLNKKDFKEINAGFYTLKSEIKIEEIKANLEGIIKFGEIDNLITTEKDYGFIIHTQIFKKINEGNIEKTSEITFKKNIISRLFTTFNPEPDFINRQGFTIYYDWNKQIKPGETFEIIIKTNWLFPLLIIFLLISIILLTKQYSKTNLILRKKISFVKAKGGEFALKVTIFINAKKYIEKVNIIDKLPPIVKIHGRFGVEQPTKVNEKTRRIEWSFEKLEQGETRVLSYIIYSKIGILGKFALPSTTAIFEREGKLKESTSNKTFFVAEQKAEKNEE
jgi:hypothetical protein